MRRCLPGVAVALGSDFNPNAHCLSMPFVMNLACVTMRMTMNEALVAATINSAGEGSWGGWGGVIKGPQPRGSPPPPPDGETQHQEPPQV
jgi:hypothetical protein